MQKNELPNIVNKKLPITSVWLNSYIYNKKTTFDFPLENLILARNNRSTQPLLRQAAERYAKAKTKTMNSRTKQQ